MADYTYVEIDDEQAKKHDKALLAAQTFLLENILKFNLSPGGVRSVRDLAEAYALLRGAAVQAGDADVNG
jgi:hypothetical protein